MVSPAASLEDLPSLATPEDEVECGHGDVDVAGESLHARLDLEVALRRQRGRHALDDAVADQVPQDVTVQNREILTAPRVPQEVTRLLEAEAIDLLHEPRAGVLRRGKRAQYR